MEITIKADAKEIADLVVAIQERREEMFHPDIQTGFLDTRILESDSTTLI